MANTLPCLVLKRGFVAKDPALDQGARGARKHIVTTLFGKKETGAVHTEWRPPVEGEKCQVVVAENWEMASFNEVSSQDRHHHLRGTEIYSVLSGTMVISVDDLLYTLNEGDTIVVNPGAVHEVIREGRFLARVITINCGGTDDKFVV